MIERKRDLSNLTNEQVEALQGKLSLKLLEILRRAGEDANLLLNQYGMEVKIGYVLKESVKENSKPVKKSKKPSKS